MDHIDHTMADLCAHVVSSEVSHLDRSLEGTADLCQATGEAAVHQPELMRKLLQSGSDVNAVNTRHETPLTLVMAHNPDHVAMLLEHGVSDVTAALHILSGFRSSCDFWLPPANYSCLAQQLVDAGADVNVCADMDDHTAAAADDNDYGDDTDYDHHHARATNYPLGMVVGYVIHLADMLKDLPQPPDANMNEGKDTYMYDIKSFDNVCQSFQAAVEFLSKKSNECNLTNTLSQAVRLYKPGKVLLEQEGQDDEATVMASLPYYIRYYELRRDIIKLLLESGADANCACVVRSEFTMDVLDDVISGVISMMDHPITSSNSHRGIINILLDIFRNMLMHGGKLSDQNVAASMTGFISMYMNHEEIYFSPRFVETYFESISYKDAHAHLDHMGNMMLTKLTAVGAPESDQERFMSYVSSFKPPSVTLKGITKDTIIHSVGGRRQLKQKLSTLAIPRPLKQYIIELTH